MQVWAKRRHFEQHGQLPDAPKATIKVPTDPVEIGKFIEAAKKGIRNNRRKMKDHPDKPLYAQLYEEHRAKYKAATGNEYA